MVIVNRVGGGRMIKNVETKSKERKWKTCFVFDSSLIRFLAVTTLLRAALCSASGTLRHIL
jgi:hypothetical protein